MDGPAQTTASETLDTLARQFQELPIANLAPALVLFLGGALLLIAGRHLLRPVLVVTTVLLGAMLGPSLLGGIFPRFGGVVLSIVGGLVGLIFMAVAWRLVLGAATGIVAAFACAIVAMLAIDAGLIDARHPNDANAPQIASADAEAHEALVGRSPEIVHGLVHWADTRWLAEPKQVRTFLTAAAAGGGFVGFVLGVWLSESAAALLTSMVGAIFVLVGSLPFIARYSDRVAQGPHPVGWMLLWLALALAGWLFQSSRAAGRLRSESTAKPADET